MTAKLLQCHYQAISLTSPLTVFLDKDKERTVNEADRAVNFGFGCFSAPPLQLPLRAGRASLPAPSLTAATGKGGIVD